MRRLVIITFAAFASVWAVGTVAAAEGTVNGVDAAIDAANSLESAIEVANNLVIQYASGALFGIGIGMLLGSGLTFTYWKRRIG